MKARWQGHAEVYFLHGVRELLDIEGIPRRASLMRSPTATCLHPAQGEQTHIKCCIKDTRASRQAFLMVTLEMRRRIERCGEGEEAPPMIANPSQSCPGSVVGVGGEERGREE